MVSMFASNDMTSYWLEVYWLGEHANHYTSSQQLDMSLNLDTLSRLLSQEKIEDTKTVIKNPLLIYIYIYIP
jgi:outer membrane receptor for monomeric catechols